MLIRQGVISPNFLVEPTISPKSIKDKQVSLTDIPNDFLNNLNEPLPLYYR